MNNPLLAENHALRTQGKAWKQAARGLADVLTAEYLNGEERDYWIKRIRFLETEDRRIAEELQKGGRS